MKKSEEDSSTEELNTENGKPIIPSNLSARKWKKKQKVKIALESEDDIEKGEYGEGKHKELVQVHNKSGKVFVREQTVGTVKKLKHGMKVKISDKENPHFGKIAEVHDFDFDRDNKVSLLLDEPKKPMVDIDVKHLQLTTKPKSSPEPQWFDKYKKYNLNKLPVNIKEEDVKVNTSGDTDTHWVLNWKDPKTGKSVQAYTRGFLQNNADLKWQRIEKIKQEDIDLVKGKSIALLKDKKLTQSTKDALAVIAIIAHTGLRPGDENGFWFSGNRGVSTLNADNIKIVKDKVFFNFTGKSYKENNAFIQNKALADYLKERVEANSDKNFLFETNKKQIDFVFKNKLGMAGFKVKDMRTYVATDMARQILIDDTMAPPPLPANKAEIKKLVQKKLDNVFTLVSQKLNNSKLMAKQSYIHPKVIEAYLLKLGVDSNLLKAYSENPMFEDFSLENIIKWDKSRNLKSIQAKEINDFDYENCDLYILPEYLE